MIFWILVALTVLITAWAIWRYWISDMGPETIIGGILASVGLVIAGAIFGGAIGAGILALAGLGVPPHVASERDEQLRAVSASSSIEGRFFLGSGYIDGKRVLNFIVQSDGYSEIRQADAVNSRIYEDESAAPYVHSYEWESEAWWWVPWAFDAGTTYDFHIPEDSILEGYTIDNSAG